MYPFIDRSLQVTKLNHIKSPLFLLAEI